MRLNGVTTFLVQATVLHRGLASAAAIYSPKQIRDIYFKDQAVLNMGSAWSNPAGASQERIIDPIESFKVDPEKDTRYRRLTQLLKLNHHDHSLFYHNLQYHNHMAHLLVASYRLGGSIDHLNTIYENEAKELEQWAESPEEIDPGNWRTHLGDKQYQRAYVHFFEEEIAKRGDDWKSTVWYYLTDKYVAPGDQPYQNNQLLHGVFEGIGHPLIHLGYALEMEDKGLAAEALAMTAASYQKFHEFVEDPNPPEPFGSTAEIREILDKLFGNPDYEDFCKDNVGHPENVLEEAPPYLEFNSYVIPKRKVVLAETFQKQVEAVVMLFTTGHKVGDPKYDFFLAHAVTSAHAMRTILPYLDSAQTWHTLRGHMILTSVVYISQCRPTIKDWYVEDYDLAGRDWDYVRKQGSEGERSHDAHFVKLLRSLEEFEKLFGKGDPKDKKYDIYLKAAVKFAEEFKGWSGFEAPSKLDIGKTKL
ncbi:hypothetical protein ABW20_dc0104958 [Dactylellina cionopaga]|nr:hypothetical protein ABW20_dc0104958 [Dactylellina cionopaga]